MIMFKIILSFIFVFYANVTFSNLAYITNEKEFYIALWKIKYNINIAKTYDIDSIIDYVNGDKICI